MNEDDDDPVVSEMPVFLSHTLESQLYVFQYPSRPTALDPGHDSIAKCCFKPENQEMLMELTVDTSNPNYDSSHGEQIAVNIDGGKKRSLEERFFQSSMMDKRSLQSTREPDVDFVAVATIKNRQLIFSPIKGILNIHPSFPHLDVTDKRAKEEAKEMGEDVSGGEEEEGEKQVTVKFARQESDRVKKAREQSYNYLSKRSAEEKWYETKYHDTSSRKSELEKGKFVSVDFEEQLGSMCLTSRQYVDTVLPVQQDPTWATPNLPSHITSLTALSHLPLPEVVSTILKEVKVITFSQLMGLLAGLGDRVKLLRCVQQSAVLVQGNWVVRSELLYPHNSLSEMNGVAGDVICRARDYILYLLSQGKLLERKQVATTVRLPSEELRQLLSQVARLRKLKGWQLLLPPDTDFIDSNPDIVERQTRAWDNKYKQLMEAFESGTPSNSQAQKGRTRKRDSSMSGGSDFEGSNRVRTPRRRKDSSLSSDPESGAESNTRRKRNSDSFDIRKVKTEIVDIQPPKKRNSESCSEIKMNGKTSSTKLERPSPEPYS